MGVFIACLMGIAYLALIVGVVSGVIALSGAIIMGVVNLTAIAFGVAYRMTFLQGVCVGLLLDILGGVFKVTIKKGN